MVKYGQQLRKKYDVKESIVGVAYHDRTVCISFESLTQREAQSIGNELKNQMVCQDIALEWNGTTELWLVDFDYLMYGDGDTLEQMLVDIGKEYGFDLKLLDPGKT